MGWLATCPDLEAASGLSEPVAARWASVESDLQDSAEEFDVPLSLATAIAYVESRFSTTAGSSAGASGVMQLMPKTRAFLVGKLEIPDFDPKADTATNIRVGVYYIHRLLRRWKGRPQDWAIASYYAGAGGVQKHGPSYYETYVNRVLTAEAAAKATFARCAGSNVAVKRWPYQKKPKTPIPKNDETPGSGGEPSTHEQVEEGGSLLLPVAVLGVATFLAVK